MPVPLSTNNITCQAYKQASDIPSQYLDLLASDAQKSNIIYPYIEKMRAQESEGRVTNDNLWLVFLSYADPTSNPTVDFIVTVTEGLLGAYPIFIYHARPFSSLSSAFVTPRVRAIALELFRRVPVPRVFSVFAAEPVTRAFASAWTERTGVNIENTDGKISAEYYAALLTFCDRRSFRDRQMSVHASLGFNIRRADPSDLLAVAELCYGFAASSDPFTLSSMDATTEAQAYIKKGQLWVHEIAHQDGKKGIASICAVTRASSTVAGITKVYTNPAYRRLGCAERLVRQVCHHYLKVEGKSALVLYVAHDNPAARSVYRRVGFRGLEDEAVAVAGVEPWLEIGFDRSVITLGHW